MDSLAGVKRGGNILKEYLVRIGWAFDKNGFDKLIDYLNNSFNGLGSKLLALAGTTKQAATIFAAAMFAMEEAARNTLEAVADLDKETQLMARQYYTSTESMMAWNYALKEMGLNYEDLFYATDELKNQFVELDRLGKSLTPPPETEKTLLLVRDIGFQFKKLNVILAYMKQWIAYFMGKMVDLQGFRDKVAAFVEKIRINMPKLAKQIAAFLSFFLRMAMYIAEFIMRIVEGGYKFLQMLDKVPGSIKMIGAALLFMIMGPMGKIIAGLTLIALLIDDYMVWKQGGKSLLDWSSFQESIEGLANAWQEFMGSPQISDFFDEASQIALQLVVDGFTVLADVLTTIVEMMKELKRLSDFDFLDSIKELAGFTPVKDENGNIDTKASMGKEMGIFGKIGSYVTKIKPQLPFTYGETVGGISSWGAEKILGYSYKGGLIDKYASAKNIKIETRDTYNVNSRDDAITIQKKKANNILDSTKNMNSSPVV